MDGFQAIEAKENPRGWRVPRELFESKLDHHIFVRRLAARARGTDDKGGVDAGRQLVSNTAYQPEYLQLRGPMDQLRKSKMRVSCAFRELIGRYRTVLSPRRRNGKGKLIRLGSRFRHRNELECENYLASLPPQS